MTDAGEVLEVLSAGAVEPLGLLPYSSNYVFLADVCAAERKVRAVYKPARGERPLWDFAHGTLAAREVAAYLISEAGGWGIVPPTVLRGDAPMGRGSLQLFVAHDPERHYLTMEDRLEEFEVFAAFDVVINNADRKSGHVIEAADKTLWAVDHGLAFNVEDKLRTVIWEFAGEPVLVATRSKLAATRDALAPGEELRNSLEKLLSRAETAAALTRTEELLAEGRYPVPESQYRLPWPLV